MKLLLTGASSFTGLWFAERLAEKGHQVLVPLRSHLSDYQDGTRAERVRRLSDNSSLEIVEDCTFGEARFLELLKSERFDVLCHHAAEVKNYKSPDFDIAAAVQSNTLGFKKMLETGRIPAVVLTGSVFESGEGTGESPLRAFSPYGLSKGLTADIIRFHCEEAGVKFGKFTIPNPFGPFEEPRFCSYLIRCWREGRVAGVNTPAYIRDNIHVSLLAIIYEQFVARVGREDTSVSKCNPSGYIETQGAFAQRYARAMRSRLSMNCELELADQTEFPEPFMRTNTQSARLLTNEWDEEKAWDEIARFYSDEAS